MDDYALALAHYRLLFPDADSLGDAPARATWKTEYDRLAESGLSATLVTNTSGGDGTSVGASRNFDQKTLLLALHARRAELDGTYLTAFAVSPPMLGGRHGSVIRFGY